MAYCSYYEDIKKMPSVSEHDLQSMLREESQVRPLCIYRTLASDVQLLFLWLASNLFQYAARSHLCLGAKKSQPKSGNGKPIKIFWYLSIKFFGYNVNKNFLNIYQSNLFFWYWSITADLDDRSFTIATILCKNLPVTTLSIKSKGLTESFL